MTTLIHALPYRGARWFLIWLAIDLAVTLILLASVGGTYLAWRAQHPWTMLLTVPPLAWIAHHTGKGFPMSARKRRIRKQLRMIRYWYTMKPR